MVIKILTLLGFLIISHNTIGADGVISDSNTNQIFKISTFDIDDITRTKTYEIIKKSYKAIGIKTKIIALPGKRSIITANSGKSDAELFRMQGINSEYKNLIMIPTSIHSVKISGYSSNKNISPKSLNQLKKYKVGILRGVIVTKKYTEGVQRFILKNNQKLLKMLRYGHIDIILENESDFDQFLKSKKITTLHKIKEPFIEVKLYHYINKKHEKLVEKLNKAIQSIIKNKKITNT